MTEAARLRVVDDEEPELGSAGSAGSSSAQNPTFAERWLAHVAETTDASELVALAFRHCHEMVYTTALRMTGSAAEAEDITQGVFETLTRNLATLRDPARIPGFLKTTAVRAALKVIRRRSWWLGRRAALLLSEPEPPVAAEDAHAIATVRQLLERLGPSERAAVVLCHVEQHSHDEAAALMEVSVKTVQRRLESARRKAATMVRGDLQLEILRRLAGRA